MYKKKSMKTTERSKLPNLINEELHTHLQIDLEDTSSRKKMAIMLMKLFEHWELNQKSQTNLLGISEQSRSVLDKYRKGDSALPKSRDILDRAGYLLAIHKALRLLYPKNLQVRYSWVTLPNRAFDNSAPLDVMKSQGVLGIARVARYLDFIRGQ